MGDSIMSKLRLHGDTSGHVDLQAPAVAGTTTIDLGTILTHDGSGNVTVNGDLSVTGNIGTVSAQDVVTEKLQIQKAGTVDNYITSTDAGGNVNLWFRDNPGGNQTNTLGIEVQPSNGGKGVYISNRMLGGAINIRTTPSGGTLQTPMIINGDGHVDTPLQPGCMIYCQSQDINWYVGDIIRYGDNASTSNTSIKAWDTTNSYDMVNSRYVAPVAGKYYVSFTANGVYNSGNVPRAYPRINGSNIGRNQHIRGNSTITGDLDHRTYAGIVHMNANDYLDVHVQVGQWDTFGANYFCMYKLS